MFEFGPVSYHTDSPQWRVWLLLFGGALEFGDLQTSTWPDVEAVGGLNYSPQSFSTYLNLNT